MGIAATLWPFGEKGMGSGSLLRARVHAWWEGYELDSPPPPSGRVGRPTEVQTAAVESDAASPCYDLSRPEPGVVWGDARRTLVQMLWGQGFVSPGGLDHILGLVNGLGLSPSASLLEVGAGMGAASRAVVEKFGAYVTALERNPDLVKEAENLNTAYSADDKVKVKLLDPAHMQLKEKYFEAALVRDVLVNVEDRADLLEQVIRSVKPEGQIMLTDFFFDGTADDGTLEAWREIEPEPVHPGSVDAVKKLFASRNMVLRYAENDGDAYRTMALSTWGDFLHKVRSDEVTPDLMGTLLHEAEIWTRRIAALESGALKYYRMLGVRNY